jgi:glycosyltransferase involved in cell wall biosynthesis
MVHLCNIRGSPLLRFLLSGADVFHASQNVAQLPKHGKVTATVHDLSCWTVAENHTTANIAATRRYAENILKKCDGVIAVSKHTRKDAMEILGIPGDRIRVIYHGIAEGFFQVTPEETAKASATYGLEAPYLLFVGCTSSLPEVVGDGGLLVAPDSLEELREAMQRLVTHPTLARDLGIRGKERAERFRWPVCARESLKFFHDVAGG